MHAAYKTLLYLLAPLLIIGGIAFVASRSSGVPKTALSAAVLEADGWTTGAPKSASTTPVTLVEFSDPECPACRAYQPIVEKLLAEERGHIRFIYRHFPLPQHKNARAAAAALDAAGKQGKFFELLHVIFDKQPDWESRADPKPTFILYARTLGLNVADFTRDMSDPAAADKIERDYRFAVSHRISATPTFFLDGKQIENPKSYDDFKSLIEKTRGQK